MSTYPKKDNRARTGSNLRGKSSSVASAIAQLGGNQSLQRLEREFRRDRAKLIKKADLRAAAKLAHEVDMEWQRASLKAG
ncbi:MAG: hypothetical protein ABIZ49_12565, partial [Opitutaceae bacterium]